MGEIKNRQFRSRIQKQNNFSCEKKEEKNDKLDTNSERNKIKNLSNILNNNDEKKSNQDKDNLQFTPISISISMSNTNTNDENKNATNSNNTNLKTDIENNRKG